jgi:hypothetical protein
MFKKGRCLAAYQDYEFYMKIKVESKFIYLKRSYSCVETAVKDNSSQYNTTKITLNNMMVELILVVVEKP